MNPYPQQIFKFNDFELDPHIPTLRHRGRLVEEFDKKTLQVLASIVAGRGNVVSHEDILEEAWPNDRYGVTKTRVNQYASRLQKLFSKYEPDLKFVKNVRGRGYLFLIETELVEVRPDDEKGTAVETHRPSLAYEPQPRLIKLKWLLAAGAAIALLTAFTFALWSIQFRSEEEEVRRVVEESQRYESLVLYRDPESFKEENLDKYWTAETDPGSNYDRKNIRTGVRKLIEVGKYYGPETKNEQFEFQSVEVNTNDDMAVVKTLEKWFISEYTKDGSLVKNKNVGPYFVSYILRKVEGRWLIEKSNTARATLPPPRLSTIETMSEAQAGRQFFVALTGDGFLPEAVSMRVVGEGCPEADPCIVPNSALVKHARLTETRLENIPLTLASGDFLIYAQHSPTAVSNPLTLHVP